MALLSGLLGLDAGKATSAAAKKNDKLLTGLDTRGQDYINTGEQKSAGYLGQAVDQFDPYNQAGVSATNTLAGSLGLGSDADRAAAQGAFQAGPGYQWAVDQAQQGVNRSAAAAGQSYSGNALIASQDRANQLANQEFGSWQDRLAGLSGQGLNAANQTAQGYTNLGQLYQDTTGQRLGLDTSVTQGRMGANNQYAKGQEAGAAGLAGLGSAIGGLAFKGFKGFWG